MARVEVHGYAIVSDDDRIADAEGRMPEILRNDADWAYFQAGLDASAVTVLGRLGHEANPNPRGRPRLVVSSSSQGLERRGDGWWWNPQALAWPEVLRQVLPRGGRVAVPGLVGVTPGSGVIMIPPVSVCHHVSTIGHFSWPMTV